MPRKPPTQYFNWEKQPKQDPALPLPKLPGGKTQKDFPSKRQYLNAQSQYAGYRNFNEWEKARELGHVKKPTPKRKREPAKVLKSGNVYIFPFEKESKTGYTIPIQNQFSLFRQMDKLIHSIEEGKYIQIYYLAHTYAKANEDRPINEWDWGSTGLFPITSFKNREFRLSGHSMLNFFYGIVGVRQYEFPDEKEDFPEGWSYRMHGKTVLGFREVHIAVWGQPTNNSRK